MLFQKSVLQSQKVVLLQAVYSSFSTDHQEFMLLSPKTVEQFPVLLLPPGFPFSIIHKFDYYRKSLKLPLNFVILSQDSCRILSGIELFWFFSMSYSIKGFIYIYE